MSKTFPTQKKLAKILEQVSLLNLYLFLFLSFLLCLYLPVEELADEEESRILLLHNIVLRLPTATIQAHLPDHQTKYCNY
jgi:hypothetical protein